LRKLQRKVKPPAPLKTLSQRVKITYTSTPQCLTVG
jgi:hypothetical protein